MNKEVKEMNSVDLQRRLLLKATGAAAGCCAMSAGVAHADENVEGPAKGDLLVPAKGESTAPLKADDIKVGSKPVLVFPYDLKEKKPKDGSRLNKLLLVRLDPAEMTDEIKARSASGVVAYSAVCTHQGCTVNGVSNGVITCPCHGSTFDLAGRVFKNKPAPDNLQVPRHMYLSDTRIAIGKDQKGEA